METRYEFDMEDLDGKVIHRDVEIHFIHADYVSGIGATKLKEFKRAYALIHHSFNYGFGLYQGDSEHSTRAQMRSLFDICNAINLTKPQPHFTAVLMSVRDHFLGICAEELKDSGLVNATADVESPCDPVRTVVWHKGNKYGQRGDTLGWDTEFLALGFHTADGGLPQKPFNEWGADPHPKSAVLQVPCVTNKYIWQGKELNATEANTFLAYLVSIYKILLFIARTDCTNP
jgi:hypothetical protein